MDTEENYQKIFNVIGDMYGKDVVIAVLKYYEVRPGDPKPLHSICNLLLDGINPNEWLAKRPARARVTFQEDPEILDDSRPPSNSRAQNVSPIWANPPPILTNSPTRTASPVQSNSPIRSLSPTSNNQPYQMHQSNQNNSPSQNVQFDQPIQNSLPIQNNVLLVANNTPSVPNGQPFQPLAQNAAQNKNDDDDDDDDGGVGVEDMQDLLESSAPPMDYEEEGTAPMLMDCLICLAPMTADEAFTFQCPSQHTFCMNCLKEHIHIAVKGNGIIHCPGVECPYEITLQEVDQISKTDAESYNRILLMRLLQQKGFVQCRCNRYFEVFTEEEGGFLQCLCHCPKCGFDFCNICRDPYHYDVTCEEFLSLRHIWYAWLEKGRQEYEEQQKAKTQDLNKKQNEFKQALEAHQENREIALRNFEILKADEEHKARTCKRCPYCRRVVERIDGCDSMVCGENYHGGDVQQGCGKGFQWDKAPPYEAEIPSQPKINEFLAKAPQQAQDYRHDESCDGCGEEIVGLRFSCLHCPSFNLCASCERVGTQPEHPKEHVFRIFTSEDEYIRIN